MGYAMRRILTLVYKGSEKEHVIREGLGSSMFPVSLTAKEGKVEDFHAHSSWE
jgi:hypothetical protein